MMMSPRFATVLRLLMFVVATLVTAPLLAEAATERATAPSIRDFSDPSYEGRFHTLTHELRCPRCQNQSIADSDAPIALDMRERTAQLLEAGYSDQEIVDFMIDRWGDFVTYRPRFGTHMIWIIALIMVTVLGLFGAFWGLRRAHAVADEQTTPTHHSELTAEEQARLAELRRQVGKDL
ncbi:cytochrome c-type biogenesis protein CcmH [Salinispirillum sp. LH 10-3-1]|uniref:Cytochrome c-type biogenesis protein n=1 Tax=Salinispirillum sp. LH 10-3-1 TaxID=2952525 RepID=A0AB38YC62_9GAMM